ncbi:MAG: hypothetical protein KF760_31400 [Candidatus Eremiobacteraeota bacterium]|nr:hypothetical protein [Candidatus Eremiobacteraeota bacterium]MCW5870944.1 hypothetical protein [Candidatus Eremiobacteraeota bacterium]
MTESDSQSIDDYLATFYRSASLDSQGRFTIDLESRARKTALQVVQPELFLIPLMMAASLGGARRFEIEPAGAGFTIRFDGQICGDPELRVLQDNLENRSPDSPDGRLRHLQAALRLAHELAVDEISLQPAESGRALYWRGRYLEVAPGGGPQGLTLRLRENALARLFGSRLVKIRATLHKLLEHRGAFDVNWYEPAAVAHLQIGPDSYGPCLGSLPSQHSGVLSLLPWGSASQALLIHHGVSFELPAQRSTTRRPFRLLLRSALVRPDLAYQSLVQSPELQGILQAIPIWLGELEWAHLLLSAARGQPWEEQFSPREIFWDMRQRALHGLTDSGIEWAADSGVDEGLGRGMTFRDSSRAYGQLRYLPVTWDKGAPRYLDQGVALLARPTPHDGILDQVYPRQKEFLAVQDRAVPATVLPGQLLPEGEFWQCSPVLQGVQLGLNLEPQLHPAMVWRFDTREAGGPLHFWKAEPPAEPMPPGLTVAAVSSARSLPWQKCLLEAFRLAWLDPRTEQDERRHTALLEHWLLAASIPALRGQLNSEPIWIWKEDGNQVFLSDIRPGQDGGLRLNERLRSLLRSLWGYSRS